MFTERWCDFCHFPSKLLHTMKHEERTAAGGEEEQGPLLSHLASHTFLHVFSRELFCFLLVLNLGLVIHIAQIMEKNISRLFHFVG